MEVLAIVGPTAIGKSEVAQVVAERLGGEVISADSMQVYRDLDIGTGKVTTDERRVPHHCIDIVNVDQPYSAADYQRDARAAIESCLSRGVLPIVCGGTGLYVRAALDTMDFVAGGQYDNSVRIRLERELESLGAQAMWSRLVLLDPPCKELIHPNNSVRVIRALEMFERGTPYSEQAAGFRVQGDHYDTVYVGLTCERALLYRRVEARIDEMLKHGWLREVEGLVNRGLASHLVDKGAIGYPELVAVVRGSMNLDQAVTAIKTGTRRYAKRQLTWFRADKRVHWVDRTSLDLRETTDAVIEIATVGRNATD